MVDLPLTPTFSDPHNECSWHDPSGPYTYRDSISFWLLGQHWLRHLIGSFPLLHPPFLLPIRTLTKFCWRNNLISTHPEAANKGWSFPEKSKRKGALSFHPWEGNFIAKGQRKGMQFPKMARVSNIDGVPPSLKASDALVWAGPEMAGRPLGRFPYPTPYLKSIT